MEHFLQCCSSSFDQPARKTTIVALIDVGGGLLGLLRQASGLVEELVPHGVALIPEF